MDGLQVLTVLIVAGLVALVILIVLAVVMATLAAVSRLYRATGVHREGYRPPDPIPDPTVTQPDRSRRRPRHAA